MAVFLLSVYGGDLNLCAGGGCCCTFIMILTSLL